MKGLPLVRFLAAVLALALPATALAQATLPVPRAPAPALSSAATPPKLIVVISVDQFSADLFDRYRGDFTGGFARMAGGRTFHNGYQSHAATETCPGHSTITTGDRPARTGIVANDWTDFAAPRADKTVYCVENERVPGSSSTQYTVSDVHLRVPTLGDRMKARDPKTRVYSVSGKDRSAIMMGGRAIDQAWWWGTGAFDTFKDRPVPPLVARFNAAIAAQIAQPQPSLDPPAYCAPYDHAVDVGGGRTVGTGRFARAAGDAAGFRASPALDGATLALAAQLVVADKLGQGPATDIITIGASATDVVGHTYGPGGLEMCLQLASLDRDLGGFFAVLDRLRIDYTVVLTADHGAGDIPERLKPAGITSAQRADPALAAPTMGRAIGAKLGLSGQLLWGGGSGDVWVDPRLPAIDRRRVTAAAIAAYRAHPQVESVFPAADIAATPPATTPPDRWTLLERVRASYAADRSGAFVVVLKRNIAPAVSAKYVAGHGSVWDYDRRVPILFWRRGLTSGTSDRAIETVDIMPTLAALIGLPLAAGAIDGKCLSEVISCR